MQFKAKSRGADAGSMRRGLPGHGSASRGWPLLCAAALLACGGGDPPAADATSPPADANAPPVVSRVRLEPAVPLPGGPVRAVVEVSDPDGDPVQMTYEWTVAGRAVGAGLPKLVLDGASKGDVVALRVVASDGRSDSDPVIARASVGNRPPVLERLVVAPEREVSAGTELEAQPKASDPDGDPIEFIYVWKVDGEPTDVEGRSFSTLGIERGQVVSVEVRASDGTDTSEPLDSGPLRVVNWPPKVTSRPGPSEPGAGFRYQVTAEDPDGDAPLRFELAEAPEGMRIGATSGEIEWTPGRDQAGVHRVRVVVDDRKGGRVSHAFDVNVGEPAGGPPAARSR